MRVTARNLTTLPKGVHTLERGVYLRVSDAGRYWICRYQKDGKRRDVGLGGIDQTLDAVRAKAARVKALVAEGIDPKEARRPKAEPEKKGVPTFEEYWPKALERLKFLRQWRGYHTEWCFRHYLKLLSPALKDAPIDSITSRDAADALAPYWDNPAAGPRMMQALSAVMDCARADGFVQSNPCRWKEGLDACLPSPAALRKGRGERHHAALSVEGMQRLAAKLRETDTIAARCLLFGILTVGRLSEFSKARWDEIDPGLRVLRVPPERRKDKKPRDFLVPLSRQALAILDELPVQGDYVFTLDGEHPLSRTPIGKQLRLADEPATIHGARSTFSDWCARTEKNFLVSEKCLMHSVGGAVFMAYQRDDLLEQRRTLLQEWADMLYSNG